MIDKTLTIVPPGSGVKRAMMSIARLPDGTIFVNTQSGPLATSSDNGRTFHEVEGGLTEYYGHRGTILWTQNNIIVVNHQGGVRGKSTSDWTVRARMSLNGGKRWVDGTKTGTPFMNKSKSFPLVPTPPGHSFTPPSLDLSSHHFLTVYLHGSIAENTATVSGVFWHIEKTSEE